MSDNATIVEDLIAIGNETTIFAAARIAELEAAVLAEREACLELCKPWRDLDEIVAAIRARSAP